MNKQIKQKLWRQQFKENSDFIHVNFDSFKTR